MRVYSLVLVAVCIVASCSNVQACGFGLFGRVRARVQSRMQARQEYRQTYNYHVQATACTGSACQLPVAEPIQPAVETVPAF